MILDPETSVRLDRACQVAHAWRRQKDSQSDGSTEAPWGLLGAGSSWMSQTSWSMGSQSF